MRKIILKKRKDMQDKELLKVILSKPSNPMQGFQLTEVRLSVKVLDKLELATDVLYLEDEEWTALKKRIETFSYGLAHRDVVDMADAVIKAEEVEVAGLIG